MKSFLKNTSKRLVCVLIIASMVLSCIAFGTEEENAPWDVLLDDGSLQMVTPPEGYLSIQNPPTFKWNYVENATYELIVAKDKELKEVVFNIKDIKYRYYNHNETLETGVDYYWAVKNRVNGKDSGWSSVRRFKIDPDATEYTVPKVDELMKRIPEKHPRIYVKPDEVEEFRGYKNKYKTSKVVYDYFVNIADEYINKGEIKSEPTLKGVGDFASFEEYSSWYSGVLANECIYNAVAAYNCAFVYLMTGEKKYADFAARALESYSTWDINGASSYQINDQTHRSIALNCAIAYDWIADTLSDSQKVGILRHIKERTLVMEYLLDSLEENQYDSHGWTALGFIGIISVATYGDIPEAERWAEKILQMYVAYYPVWSYEDGGWGQGTGYSRWSRQAANQFTDVLVRADILNPFKSGWQQRAYLWPLYAFPNGFNGSFGDQGGPAGWSGASFWVEDCSREIAYIDDPELAPLRKWICEVNGGLSSTHYANYWLAAEYDSVDAKTPEKLQLSNDFHDIGWITMSDNLADNDRVMLTFKSSPFGSYNHSNADQNAFFINAYGSNLASRSGYYDGYNSPHNSGLTRKTGAHNSVTVATNVGQKDQDQSADGQLEGYLTQADFDLAKGDATESYKGALGEFERSIVYIRPDIFVVVDDLKSSEEGGSQFEWWLNSETDIKLHDEGNGAKIENGKGALDAVVQYPEKVKSYYNDIWALSDMQEAAPPSGNLHTRVWFETEKVEETKMVVTIDVHRNNKEARYVKKELFEKYMKMTFADGTVMYVNLGDEAEEVVTKEGISFTGELVVFNDESIMLGTGTSLKEGETVLISLESPGSVVMGKNELSISTYVDNKVTVNVKNDYVSGITKVTDFSGREISDALGIAYELSGDNAVFTMDADNYQLLLNGKTIVAEYDEGTAKVIINGEEQIVKTKGVKGRSGEFSYSGTLKLAGKYETISFTPEVETSAPKVGQMQTLTSMTIKTPLKEGSVICLKQIPSDDLAVDVTEDYDEIKKNLDIFVEAESYVGDIASGASVYDTRSFLSGGKGVQLFNTPGTKMSYEFEVKEEGDYLFAVKYVAWEAGGASRRFMLDGKEYGVALAQTVSWGTEPAQWRAMHSSTSIHLTPGKYTITFEAEKGSWNFDWFGFTKK